MARPMTPAEKQRFRGYFPSLDVNRAVVTGEVSTWYNPAGSSFARRLPSAV
jgi:hypothetical protein